MASRGCPWKTLSIEWDRPPLDQSGEILTVGQLEDEEGLPAGFLESVDGRDVLVAQRSEYVSLALEAGQAVRICRELLGEELQCDVATELRVAGSIDLPHSSLPERGEDLERAEAGSGREGHSCSGCRGS